MNWFWSVFTDLGVLFLVAFPIESVSPKRTLVGVSLVVAPTVRTFEWVGAWFALLGFQSWWVDLGICLATPTKFSMVFRFVRTIAFDAFGTLDSTWKCWVSPFPAVFALRNAGVHVGSPNGCNEAANIKAPIDKHFCVRATLDVPDIQPNNCHVRFRRYFDYS